MKTAISPRELTATLKYLAIGRSYKDLEYRTITSKQALLRIIPQISEAIYKVLQMGYLKVSK